MKNRISLTILPVLACLALSPQAHAICTKGYDAALFNTFAGDNALISNTGGSDNTATWDNALLNNLTGGTNTAVGSGALLNCITGSDNIALGSSAGSAVIDASSVIAIGSDGGNVSDSCFIGNIRDIQ